MAALPESLRQGRRCESIHIGGVAASANPLIIRTVLGSCISVCLRDPAAKVGGMNHFMLPNSKVDTLKPTSYGVHAMELLINRCMSIGAERSRLEAKVFGGGHVLNIRSIAIDVARHNIDFAKKFLKTERIPVVAHDVGGYAARELFFFTDTGKVLLNRLSETGLSPEVLSDIAPAPAPAPPVSADDDNVTLF